MRALKVKYEQETQISNQREQTSNKEQSIEMSSNIVCMSTTINTTTLYSQLEADIVKIEIDSSSKKQEFIGLVEEKALLVYVIELEALYLLLIWERFI